MEGSTRAASLYHIFNVLFIRADPRTAFLLLTHNNSELGVLVRDRLCVAVHFTSVPFLLLYHTVPCATTQQCAESFFITSTIFPKLSHYNLLHNHSPPKSLSPSLLNTRPAPEKLRSIKLNQLKFSRCRAVIITQQHVTFTRSTLRVSTATPQSLGSRSAEAL